MLKNTSRKASFFRDTIFQPVQLFTDLLDIYQVRHFPYNWVERKWPEEKLVVL